MSTDEIPRFFFNWRRINILNSICIGKNYIFHPRASGCLSDLILRFPVLGTLVLLFFSRHKHIDIVGTLHLLSPFGMHVLWLCPLLHLTLCSAVTFSEKPSLTPPHQNHSSSFIPSSRCVTPLHSPYHCLPWFSIFIYLLFCLSLQ